MKRLFLVLLFFPLGVSAALNAGVVEGVWFSTPTPSEGESVRIFTAIQNQSDQTITGSVSFLVNSEIVGSTDFFVTKNNVVPVSVEYVFTGGNHDVSAYITSVKEQSVTYTTLSDTSVSVARKEKKALALPTNIPEVIETIKEKAVTGVNPFVESVVEKLEDTRDKILPLEIEEESAAKELVETVKVVSSIEGLEIWKKAGVIGLTILSFLVRMWFVFVILFVAFVFWRGVRGRRVR